MEAGAERREGEERERRLVRSWEANAEAWTRAVREGRIASRRAGTDEAVLGALADRPPRRLLDLGCGEGWLARRLAGSGFEVVGVDASERLIERARALGGGEFRVLSYDEIAAEPASLGGPYHDVVCNFSLLGERLGPLLVALRSALADDGRLLIQTVHPFSACGEEPYRDGWRIETFGGFGGEFEEPMPWYFRTVGSWVAELGEAGFGVERCREPLHPETGRPLSLVLTCVTARLPA